MSRAYYPVIHRSYIIATFRLQVRSETPQASLKRAAVGFIHAMIAFHLGINKTDKRRGSQISVSTRLIQLHSSPTA
jgi:hypothetical protein